MFGGPLDGTRQPTDKVEVEFVFPRTVMCDHHLGVQGTKVRYVRTNELDRQGCVVYRLKGTKAIRLVETPGHHPGP